MRVGIQLPEVEREVRWPEYAAGVDEAILVADSITRESINELEAVVSR